MSITLTNALSVSQGASVIETDPQAAVMTMSADFQITTPSFNATLKAGNVSGVSLNPGSVTAASGNITIGVDLTSGRWSASNGVSGTLSGAALTSLTNSLKTLRNTVETFATANGIIVGSQVAW